MTGLPNIDRAIVEERKIAAYLLSDGHPTGRVKAAYFKQFGFRIEDWHLFQAALVAQARTGEVSYTSRTQPCGRTKQLAVPG